MDIQTEDSRKSIYNTLIYSDIFDYPLTSGQLYTFLIADKPFTKNVILEQVKSMQQIVKKGDYYVLSGRESLIRKRKEKKRCNREKIIKAKKIAKLVSFIPTVYFIGISGGVAMENAEKEDDIDFFIITQKETVWITRLALLIILQLLGVLRKRGTTQVNDMICLNMLLDETMVSFPKNRQDLYNAHEIVQLYPLIERHSLYQKFIRSNSWIRTFLPHAQQRGIKVDNAFTMPLLSTVLFWIMSFPFVEFIAQFLQRSYMKKNITNETISSSFLAFHPFDYREKTLALYNKRINEEI
jgi:hypothetical protein